MSLVSIIWSYFQGSNSTLPEEVENIFIIAENRLKSFKKASKQILPLYILLFNILGLAKNLNIIH
jgi:hypothetical protein